MSWPNDHRIKRAVAVQPFAKHLQPVSHIMQAGAATRQTKKPTASQHGRCCSRQVNSAAHHTRKPLRNSQSQKTCAHRPTHRSQYPYTNINSIAGTANPAALLAAAAAHLELPCLLLLLLCQLLDLLPEGRPVGLRQVQHLQRHATCSCKWCSI